MPRGSLTPHPGAPVAILFLRAQEAVRSEPPIEWPLRIFTLGRFGLVAGERGIATENWERKQALTLLKYLITNLGRAVHRERLIECLWPNIDESRGRNRLKVAVYYVRQQLRAANVNESVVATVGTAYVLRREAVWLDSDAFESLVAQGAGLERQQQRDDALRCYEDAQHLYRGDYLEEEPYADWCAEERERLREVYLETLARIARGYAARGHHAKAAQVCRTALVRDPCRESFHRSLMTHLVQLGHRDQAMAQFHHCQRVLADELGVDPMPETQRLYQNILEDREAAAGVTVRRVFE